MNKNSSSVALPDLNLFGLTEEDGMKELKARYYEYALLCHPDRGGHAEDMVIVQKHYARAKRELEARETSKARMHAVIEKVREREEHEKDKREEEEASSGCSGGNDDGSTAEEAVPDMRSIFDEVHGELQQQYSSEAGASDEWWTGQTAAQEEMAGYGSLMEESEYQRSAATSSYLQYSSSVPAGGGSLSTTIMEEPVTQTCIVEARCSTLAALCPIGLADETTRETGFGILTNTPTQLPLTDYVVAHASGEYSTIIHDGATELADEHLQSIHEDVCRRCADGASAGVRSVLLGSEACKISSGLLSHGPDEGSSACTPATDVSYSS